MAFCEDFEFTCAVRGFHVYRKFWIPEKGQLLNCFHGNGNLFDPFAIKFCESNSETPVTHLPPEISRATKFIIEREATVDLELTSDHYKRSPLVQSGLEIKCKVTVKVPCATPRLVTERYRAIVKEPYIEPKEEEILGSLIVIDENESMDEDFSIQQRSTRPRKQPTQPNESIIKSKDRTFFNKERNIVAHACTENKIIVIDYISNLRACKGIFSWVFFTNALHLKNYYCIFNTNIKYFIRGR